MITPPLFEPVLFSIRPVVLTVRFALWLSAILPGIQFNEKCA